MNTRRFQRGESGFAAFYAVLVITVLLTVSLKMLDVALKGQILSSGSRESLKAFYAADSGVECALYNDLRIGRIFEAPEQNRAGSVTCGSSSFPLAGLSEAQGCPAGAFCTIFTYPLSPTSQVDIVVKKKDQNNNQQIRTLVEARGYHVANGVKKLERAVRTEYGDSTAGESPF